MCGVAGDQTGLRRSWAHQTWRGVLIDQRRQDILGTVLTIGMSSQPKLVETTRAHMSLIFDPPLETDTRGEY